MSHNLPYVITMFILGLSCLAQDNVVRVKAPQDPGHEPTCWFLLAQAEGKGSDHFEDYWNNVQNKHGLIDDLWTGELPALEIERNVEADSVDKKRAEFGQNSINLGYILSSYNALLINDLPPSQIPKARLLKSNMDSLAEESGLQWVPYLPGVTEVTFKDGFIEGVKLDWSVFLRVERAVDRRDFFSRLPHGVTSLELDLENVPDDGLAEALRDITAMNGFSRIKELKIDTRKMGLGEAKSNIFTSLRSLAAKGVLNNLIGLEHRREKYHVVDYSTLLSSFPNLKKTGEMGRHFWKDDLDYQLESPTGKFHELEIIFFSVNT